MKDRDDIKRYRMSYPDNQNSIMLKGMQKHKDLTFDYYVHIAREFETEFSGMLFKRIIREVKRNCVSIKYTAPVYIGKEMYKNKDRLVFSGERTSAFTVTNTDEAKEWYRQPKLRAFADKSFTEQLAFLQDVFYGKELKNYKEEEKNFSENYQIYRIAASQPWRIKDLSLLKEIFALFDDDIKTPAAFKAMATAMEDLCDASVYVASRQKPDGIRILLEHLHDIPKKGYHCGCEGIVRILLKKKYYERFKICLTDVTDDTKVLVKTILESITDKKTAGQRKELINLLNQEL